MTQNDSANAGERTVLDKLAGKAKEVVGAVIGNDTLVEEGELQQRKAEAAKRATELAGEAEQREAEAELTAEQAANRIEQQRVAAELAERNRVEQLERERLAAEASVERVATQRAEALDQQHRSEERLLDNNEVDVVVDLAEDISDANALEAEAARAERTAEALRAAQNNVEQR